MDEPVVAFLAGLDGLVLSLLVVLVHPYHRHLPQVAEHVMEPFQAEVHDLVLFLAGELYLELFQAVALVPVLIVVVVDDLEFAVEVLVLVAKEAAIVLVAKEAAIVLAVVVEAFFPVAQLVEAAALVSAVVQVREV
jgi:hypothetical protein